MKNPSRKEQKKPKTAPDKGKRYRCCVCRKKAPQKTKTVPYYCSVHSHLADRFDSPENTTEFDSIDR